jgi:hypothetical protein
MMSINEHIKSSITEKGLKMVAQHSQNQATYKIKMRKFLHLFSFKTPILLGKKIRKNVKSIIGISPTMVLLFHLPCFYLKM